MKFTGCLSGTLSPDASGDYAYAGMHGGKPYFYGGVVSHYIWFEDAETAYVIGTVLGVMGANHWLGDQAGIVGTYSAQGVNTGVATYAEGVCP